MTASTRPIHSRQRSSAGRSASSLAGLVLILARRPISEAVEPEAWTPRQFTHGAERDQALEQPAAGAIAGGLPSPRRLRVLAEQGRHHGIGLLAAQFWRCCEQAIGAMAE